MYRLLRDNESITNGIDAKEPYARVSIDHHVAYGSRCSSQFISTSATKSAVKKLVGLKIYGDLHNIRIVRINLKKLKRRNSSAKIIDLTDDDTAEAYLNSSRAINFAMNFDEVLIKGHIPRSAIRLIYKGHKSDIYDKRHWIKYDTSSSDSD